MLTYSASPKWETGIARYEFEGVEKYAAVSFDRKDEIGQLIAAMNDMLTVLQHKADIVERIAQKDLTVAVEKSSDEDGLGESLMVMKNSVNEILFQVNVAVGQGSSGADQVSGASQSISHGATEQTSSLEAISESAAEQLAG